MLPVIPFKSIYQDFCAQIYISIYSYTYVVISDSWTWAASQGKFNYFGGADRNFLEETKEVLELVFASNYFLLLII